MSEGASMLMFLTKNIECALIVVKSKTDMLPR